MQKIATFEKVSFAEYEKANPGKTAEEWRAVYDGIALPTRATAGSAGYDFFAPYELVVGPGESVKVPTGIRAKMEDGWVLVIVPRSGLGFKYRFQLDNTVGIIDADYYFGENEGHIFCKLTNCSTEGKTVCVEKGKGFCQGIFLPFGVTTDDAAEKKRMGGFGSTDV